MSAAVDPGDVLGVGDADEDAAATPAGPAYAAAVAWASSNGQSAPGGADHTARGSPPAARCFRNASAVGCSAQAASAASASKDAGRAEGPGGSLSVVAWRGGTASRSTSLRVPA